MFLKELKVSQYKTIHLRETGAKQQVLELPDQSHPLLPHIPPPPSHSRAFSRVAIRDSARTRPNSRLRETKQIR